MSTCSGTSESTCLSIKPTCAGQFRDRIKDQWVLGLIFSFLPSLLAPFLFFPAILPAFLPLYLLLIYPSSSLILSHLSPLFFPLSDDRTRSHMFVNAHIKIIFIYSVPVRSDGALSNLIQQVSLCLVGEVDEMTFRGLFQPNPFYVCIYLYVHVFD